MAQFVALLRGVNVGKAKRVPMAELRALLEELGCSGVRTLLNSGNAVFQSGARSTTALAAKIHAALLARLDVDVPVVVLTAQALQEVVAGNPLAVDADQHSRLLVAFAQQPAALAGLAGIKALVRPPERLAVGALAAYLHCAGGILESRAGAALLGKAGQALTTRNWATVLKLATLVAAGDHRDG
jgi:uncharacterized protein (DUF1697 family)